MLHLDTWNNGNAKTEITEFIEHATTPESKNFIPVDERIAVFDVDGTILVEKPNYCEVLIALRRLCELHKQNPVKYSGEIYTAACDDDYDYFTGPVVYQALLQAFLAQSQKYYLDYVNKQVHHLNHPYFQKPLLDLIYAPMRQLIIYLVSQHFRVYLVSGSQQGFVRAIATAAFRFPNDRGLGSRVALKYEYSKGAVDFVRQERFLEPEPDAKGKPEYIWEDFGGYPVLAFGNTMGDFEMLQFASSHRCYQTFAGIIVHDDGAREYEYFDLQLEKEAKQYDWLRVSMKDDFGLVFN